MKKRSKTGCILTVLIGGAAFALLVAALLALGFQAYLDSPRQVADFDFGEPVPEAYQLSGQQIALIQQDGYPQSFSILFYSDRDVKGDFETIRFEEWSYPNLGWSYLFENGELISADQIEQVPTIGTAYRPEAFIDFINRKQVAAAGGIDEWMIVPVEKELVDDADLYYAEGLTFGLRGEDLVFIEAVGFESVEASSIRDNSHAAAKSVRSLTPACSLSAEPELYHSMDNALLLMISSQMRMSGEVTSVFLPGGRRVSAPSLQAGGTNEVDVLIDLYEAQVNKLRDGDAYDQELEDRLINELEDKLVTLNAKAQELNVQRSQRRNRGGIAGFINRGLKSLGRGAGWLMGQAMDGAGKITQFAIEEVAPQVLKEAIQGGVPLNAALVRQVARRLLIDRVGDAIYLQQYRRANRLAGPPLDPAAEATELAEFMDLGDDDNYVDADEGPSIGTGFDDPVSTPGSISEGSSGGSGITEKRPVAFNNTGFETVTIRPSSYTPSGGGVADMPVASTIVTPSGGSSAILELPLGEYVFCIEWDRGIDYDNDGYVDYEHGYTGSFNLSESASTDPSSAVVVTFSAPGNNTGRGKCSEQLEAYTNLTPQESAAVEYNTYDNTETENNGEVSKWTDTRRYEFTETGVFIIFPDMGVVGFYQRVGPNEYVLIEGDTTTLTFTNEGMIYIGTYDGGYTTVSIRAD